MKTKSKHFGNYLSNKVSVTPYTFEQQTVTMEKIPNKITLTFIKEVESIIERGVAANHAEIATAIKWNKSGMSLAMKRKRNVPNRIYKRFTAHYGLENETATPMVMEPETPAYGLKTPISDKDKIITLLEERVASLKEDNESLKRRLNLVAAAVLEQLSMIHAKVETNQGLLSELMVKQKVVPTDSIDDKIDRENAENFLRERKKLEHIVPL